jgi:branched-chain amino acid transport system ATP-binding protein
MLKVENISSGYDKKQVLFNVSFELRADEIVLLSGGNGSGKSTLLRCIYGLLPIWNKEGKILFCGQDITKLPTSEMVKKGIVFIPQKNNYFESLSIHENLVVSGTIYPKKIMRDRLDEVYKLPNLYKNRNRTPFDLSGGEKQLLALGIGLMHSPKLVYFDEPFAGLDDINTKIIFNEIINLKKNGIGILIVEHKKIFINYSDRVLEMYLGQLKDDIN